ncbi:MAG: hypothetical protein M1831_000155 [Alyxoria varia]|nr:MAG: hypothetical protein M1831_000155 [Alyxoria varia]
MPLTILPASAAAFSPRSAPTIVLGPRVETWLTHALKRINRIRRPLNTISQHYRCLNEALSGPSAIWTLASIMVPKAPDSELKKDSNPLVEAVFNYQLIHVEAYVVHVDMVSQNEIAFKLTQDTIDDLIEYHRDIYSVDVAASTWDWSEKEQQLKKLQDDFVQAINRYVYRTHVRALEGLEDDGAGELLEGRSEEVKNAIMGLFLPLLPPPPRIVDVVHPQTVGQPFEQQQQSQWWQPQVSSASSSPQEMTPAEPWRVLGSTPSPTEVQATSAESVSSPWTSAGFNENSSPGAYRDTYDASPSPPYSEPYTSSTDFFSAAQAIATIPQLPLPSALAQQCGASVTRPGYGGFSWNDNNFAPQFPIFT